MIQFKHYLEEGKNDKSIFHAIFMAGGPGSGKSYVVGQLGLLSLNFKDINSDSALEKAMKLSLMDMEMPDGQAYAKDIVRGISKKKIPINDKPANVAITLLRNAFLPILTTACNTIASTAAFRPKNMAATTSTSPYRA